MLAVWSGIARARAPARVRRRQMLILFRLHIDTTIICTGVCAGTTNGKLLASHMLFDVVCVRLADITPVSLHGKFMRVQDMRAEKCARVRSFFIRPNTSANFRFTFDLSHSLMVVHRPVCLFLLLPSSLCHSNLRSAFRSVLFHAEQSHRQRKWVEACAFPPFIGIDIS